MASEAQNEANRQNARRSTGPTSETGKSRSALNALKHGGYGRGGWAIPRGAFAEDPNELAAMLEATAAALGPRDEIERRQAIHVAGLMNQQDRVVRLQAHSMAGDSNHQHLDELVDSAQYSASILGWAQGLSDALSRLEEPAETYPWMLYAHYIIKEANGGKQLWVPPIWVKDRTPETEEEWRDVTLKLLKHLFKDLDSGATWAFNFYCDHADKAEALSAEWFETSAARILNGHLDQTVRLSGSIGRQLTQAIDLYRKLQERVLDEGEAGEADNAAEEPASPEE